MPSSLFHLYLMFFPIGLKVCILQLSSFDFQILMNASLVRFLMNIFILLTTVTAMQIAQTTRGLSTAHVKMDSLAMGSDA